jgi:hypothetical protein
VRRTPLSSPAAAVTAFVQTALTPRVVLVEGTLATANQALLSACRLTHAYDTTLMKCTDPALMDGGRALARTLAMDANVLFDASHALAAVDPPPGGPRWTVPLALTVEDLVLCSDGLGSLLAESAAAMPLSAPAGTPPPVSIDYASRVLKWASLLQRAQAWLETVDRDTGAHANLPGFVPGTQPLETLLGLE